MSKKIFDAETVIRRLDLEGVAEISKWFEDKNFRRFLKGKGPLAIQINMGVYGEEIYGHRFQWNFFYPPKSTP